MSKKDTEKLRKKSKPVIGIIGGKGKMGNWFKRFFESQGFRVIISDRKTKLSNTQLAKKADIIIISTPIKIVTKVIREIASCTKKDSLITDLASIKSKVVEEMKKINCPTLGMHPLFGPLCENLKNQNIVFCPTKSKFKNNKWIKFLKEIFERNGAKVIEIPAEKHDFEVAILQALTHFSNLSFSYFIFKKKFKPRQFFMTPVFKLQSLVFGRILAQNPKLYADIEMENPFFKKILEEYLEEEFKLSKNIKEKNYKKFEEKFQKASFYFSNFIKISEEKSTQILKIIEKQPVKIGPSGKINFSKARIGYLGPKGTFSWLAAEGISLKKSQLIPFSTIREIFEAVNNSEIDFGVVPIYNTTAGIVSETIYTLIDYPIYTLGSFFIPIHYSLLSKEKNFRDIKEIKSHPQSFSQCRWWLSNNLANVLKIPTASTISAIEKDKDKKGVGFIVPLESAKIFKLNLLAKNIEDFKENSTKFLLIAREINKNILKKVEISKDRSLLFLSVYDRLGILRDILNVFVQNDINLTALHSIPGHFHPWDYLFFIEAEVPYFSKKLKKVVKILNQNHCPFIRIVGAA